jgi:hypothetical protein
MNQEKSHVKTTYSFDLPSLNVPFQEDTQALDLLNECIESCDDAELSFRAEMAKTQRLAGLQELYSLNEFTRPARQSLQSLRNSFKELAVPIALPDGQSRYNELQERRQEVLQEAIEREAKFCSLPEGSPDVDYLEDLLWRASAIADEHGHEDVRLSEEQLKLVTQGEMLLAAGNGPNMKRYFKDSTFFKDLAKELRKLWPRS